MVDKNDRALVPGSAHLPAVIEQRTRIINRVMGELTSRDTEAFFRRHPEFFRLVVSRYYPLSEELIGRFEDWWAWEGLSSNKGLPWTEVFIGRFAEHWDWEGLSRNKELPWSEALIDHCVDLWDWEGLSRNKELPWNEALIERYVDRWDWKGLSRNKELPWSEALIERYADRWDWEGWGLSRNHGLPWNEALIERYVDRWNWEGLSWNKELPWNEALIGRYVDRWDWEGLSWNEGLPWSEALIERYVDRWNWEGLSWNEGLPWNEALIGRYVDRWDWWGLSQNQGLPWNEALIERFTDRWDWEGLSWNEGLPWSEALIERYADRWDVRVVAYHYDGGVQSLTLKQIEQLIKPDEDRYEKTLPFFKQAPLKPLSIFHDRLRDGSNGPAMIVIPSGEFWMGSPESEIGRRSNECRHRVLIARPFAIGQYAVTFGEYDRYCADQGRTKPDDKNWCRGTRPVINVSWVDALDYTEWLSAQTGKNYRLPTEAEWEYAARAGTETAFWWGNEISPDQANYNGNYTYRNGPKGVCRKKTVPVDDFQPNPWGLYQVHGNVYEWTGSQYEENYNGKEMLSSDEDPVVATLAIRSGCWANNPRSVRSASRFRFVPTGRDIGQGFRLARYL